MSGFRVGVAADHGGFELKGLIVETLRSQGCAVDDFGAHRPDPADDYPDFVIPLAHAVASGRVGRGLALCGSGVGASIAANKVAGVRAGLIHDVFSARQGVEDDDMNVLCLGGKVIGAGLALALIDVFLAARFSGAPRHQRRLAKVQAIDKDNEGGAGDGGRVFPASVKSQADALPLTNAELVQLQIRVIALENLLAALLADASDRQLDLAREIAECIAPRPGFTAHRLTTHAAARMTSLIERAGHLRSLQSAAANVGDSPLCGPVLDIGGTD